MEDELLTKYSYPYFLCANALIGEQQKMHNVHLF